MALSRCINADVVTDIVVRARTYSGTFSRNAYIEPQSIRARAFRETFSRSANMESQSMPLRARVFSETLVRKVPNKTVAPIVYYAENKFLHMGKVITRVLNKPLKELKKRKKNAKEVGKDLMALPANHQKFHGKKLRMNVPLRRQCVYMTQSHLWRRVRDHFLCKNSVLYRQPINRGKAITDGKVVSTMTKRGPNKLVQKLRTSSLRKLKLPVHRRRKSRMVAYIRNSKLSRMALPHNKGSYRCDMVHYIKESSWRKKLGLLTVHSQRRSRVVQMIRDSPVSKVSLPVF